jgi:glycosyltransferase involved in cell wall biosynthesis
MKVLHVIKSLGLGGAERLLVDAARIGPSLSMHHQVVSFLPHKTALVSALQAAGAPVTMLSATSSLAVLSMVDRLARHIRIGRPDVVHAHLPIASIVARLACRAVGVPMVSTEHNVLERYHPATRLLTLSTWNLQHHVIACSDEVAASIDRHVPARGAPPVTTVKNGIDVEHFVVDDDARARVRADLGVNDDDVLVGTVAVFRTQKALDVWLQVAKAVHTARPNTRFVIVGDGPERARLQALCAELGLNDVVTFPGLLSDPLPSLSAMDIWLSTSTFEGLPLALLEALAMERAVVCTAVGGVAEVVADRFNGRLLKAGDSEGLTAAVIDLVDDDSLRRRLGITARAVVERRFGTEQMQRALRDIYDDVIRG